MISLHNPIQSVTLYPNSIGWGFSATWANGARLTFATFPSRKAALEAVAHYID